MKRREFLRVFALAGAAATVAGAVPAPYLRGIAQLRSSGFFKGRLTDRQVKRFLVLLHGPARFVGAMPLLMEPGFARLRDGQIAEIPAGCSVDLVPVPAC